MDVAGIAVAAAKYVVPYLVTLRNNAADTIAKKAGEVVVDKTLEGAQGVWNHLTDWYKDDHKFITLSEYLKSDPVDENSQRLMASELAERLEKEPEKATQLQKLLGGEAAINSLIVGEEAVVEHVNQYIKERGKNVIDVARKGKATDIVQKIE